jgi:metal-responsive CopG/Arc/MetJ family transcriptional regulator
MKSNISVNLGHDLMRVFQEDPLLRFVNRSRLIRDAVTDFIERMNQERRNDENKGEK